MYDISKLLYISFIFYINKIHCDDVSKVVVKNSNDSSSEAIKAAKESFKSLKSKCERMDNEDLIKCLISTFLNVFDLNLAGFCKPNDQYCRESIKDYTGRCSANANSCHLLNNVKLISFSEGDIYAPNLVQAEVANYVFRNSGARKRLEWPKLSCVGECNWHCDCKTIECEYQRDTLSFNKTILMRNMYEMGVDESKDIGLLQKFVYLSCLYYNDYYVYKEDGKAWYNNRNLQPALRYLKSHRTRKKFSKMRRNSKMRVFISYHDIQKLFDVMLVYLSDKAYRKYKQIALSFVKVFRYTLIKSVPYYKHSYLFSYYLKKNKIDFDALCDKYSPDGPKLVEGYLKRCKDEGECYLFDDYKLFPDDHDGNYLVPQLSEVNLVYYLLKHISYKYGKLNSFFTNTSRPRAEIQYMAPRLLTVNKKKFQHMENSTQKIIQAYLYYSAVYFVRTYREWWTTRQLRHVAGWNVKPKLATMLCKEAMGASLIIDENKLKEIFPAFKEYLSTSYFKKHPNRVKRYSKIVEDVLMEYYNGQSSTSCCC